MKPVVGTMYVTESGYKALVTVDFLVKVGKIDELGCRYGGYLIAPGKDKYVWWTEDGNEPRHPEATLKEEYIGPNDPTFQPLLESIPGLPRAMAHFYTRFEDIQREWGAKTAKAVRIQFVDGVTVSHTVDLTK